MYDVKQKAYSGEEAKARNKGKGRDTREQKKGNGKEKGNWGKERGRVVMGENKIRKDGS